VRTLSGGERNRLLLARLMALPANVLVLDEPTNDLDLETLELLEERLQAYAGTLLLVSHDRRFVDNVVTSTIAWEGDATQGGRPGLWREYEGGYEDWRTQRERTRVALAAAAPRLATAPGATPASPAPAAPAASAASAASVASASPATASRGAPDSAARHKLSYKETRELQELPARIEALEAEQRELAAQMEDPNAYTKDPRAAAAAHERWAAIEEALMACLERWEALSQRS
jgi:ATP-binding cassette subfamily F protein uup